MSKAKNQATDELTQKLIAASAVFAEAASSVRHAATKLDAIQLQLNKTNQKESTHE